MLSYCHSLILVDAAGVRSSKGVNMVKTACFLAILLLDLWTYLTGPTNIVILFTFIRSYLYHWFACNMCKVGRVQRSPSSHARGRNGWLSLLVVITGSHLSCAGVWSLSLGYISIITKHNETCNRHFTVDSILISNISWRITTRYQIWSDMGWVHNIKDPRRPL